MRYLYTLIFLSVASIAFAQHSQIQIDGKEATIETWLNEISQKAAVTFTYNSNSVPLEKKVTLPYMQTSISEILTALFESTNIEFVERKNKIILINPDREENKNATISGFIKESGSGESLIGATLLVKSDSADDESPKGVVSNAYGFYSLTLPIGTYNLQYSYIGYETITIQLVLTQSTSKTIELVPASTQLDEVVITAETDEDPLQIVLSPIQGKTSLNIGEIKKMPALMGEVDVIKSIQTLPGVRVQGEGSTNFFVRGGNADQNLILLDEAPVYNASHLMGFFSVFNPDAIKNVQFYRSGMPAQYGGRLSSLLDIRMKEGNQEKFSTSGGIGLTASRITLEGPIKKEESSFMVSARRTYADLFLNLSADEFTRKSSIYFYDLNAKLNWTLDDKNKLYLSGYFGRDVNKFLSLQYAIDWGNATSTMRWNHLFNDKLFLNTTLLYSNYEYRIDLSNQDTNFNWNSQIQDFSLKSDFTYYANANNQLSFGLNSAYHQFEPGRREGSDKTGVPDANAIESGLYINNEQRLNDRIAVEYGARLSLYQLIGPSTTINFSNDHLPIGEQKNNKGSIYKTYGGLEPRLSARYLLTPSSSLKVNYNRSKQYMQLLSNLSLGLNVFDIWFPSTAHTPPQSADHYTMGYFKDFKDGQYEFSVETYYKKMTNQVDYKDHAQLIMNRYLEGELRTGIGRAYGAEFSLRKNKGNITGWLNYNYSKAERKIPELNGDTYYNANYDQPHAISAGAHATISKRWSVSTNFVYATGRPITLPIESYRYEGHIVPVYGKRNASRLPDYHRLDVTFTLNPKEKENRKNESYWSFGLYNVYDRHNASTAFVSAELEDIDVIKNKGNSAYQKLYLFGIIPSVTYNFKF